MCKCACEAAATSGSRASAVVRAVALGTFLALACVGGLADGSGKARGAAGPDRTPAVRVVVELFQVVLLDQERLMFLRQEAPLDTRGPDVAVAELQRGGGPGSLLAEAAAIVHSTSWRFERDGTVVLTYLAFGERPSPSAPGRTGVQTMPWRKLPGLGPTDPDRPSPAVLRHEDVLAHGLRHLALLARRRDNDAFAARLTKAGKALFAAVEPEIAGKIGSPAPDAR
jgi:hypothetical protein